MFNFLCLYAEFYRNNLFVDFGSSFHAASVPVSHVLLTAKFTYMYISLFRDFPSLYVYINLSFIVFIIIIKYRNVFYCIRLYVKLKAPV